MEKRIFDNAKWIGGSVDTSNPMSLNTYKFECDFKAENIVGTVRIKLSGARGSSALVPDGTTAVLNMPDGSVHLLDGGKYSFECEI